MRHKWHERYTKEASATLVLHERHECDTCEKFDFDNNTSENIFSHPYINFMVNEWLQGEEQFHLRNYLLEMSRSHAKMHLKGAQQNWTL